MSESGWSLETFLGSTARLAIDSNVLIYFLEGNGPRAAAASAIIDAIEAGRVQGILASVGVTEVLAGVARDRDAAVFETVAEDLRDLSLRIRPLDVGIAEDAAWLRGEGLALEDAVHLATARAERATVFITNDRRIRSRPGLDVLYLDDLVVDEPQP